MAKETIPKTVLERTYNVPLRREFQKVPGWRRTKKAVTALRQFLSKHMKSDNVKLGKELNEKLWQHGIKNPPHHVKVSVTKDDQGEVRAELFGVEKKEVKKEVKKETKRKELVPEDEEKKALQTDKPEVKEEKLPQEKDEKATQSVPSKKNQLN